MKTVYLSDRTDESLLMNHCLISTENNSKFWTVVFVKKKSQLILSWLCFKMFFDRHQEVSYYAKDSWLWSLISLSCRNVVLLKLVVIYKDCWTLLASFTLFLFLHWNCFLTKFISTIIFTSSVYKTNNIQWALSVVIGAHI